MKLKYSEGERTVAMLALVGQTLTSLAIVGGACWCFYTAVMNPVAVLQLAAIFLGLCVSAVLAIYALIGLGDVVFK